MFLSGNIIIFTIVDYNCQAKITKQFAVAEGGRRAIITDIVIIQYRKMIPKL